MISRMTAQAVCDHAGKFPAAENMSERHHTILLALSGVKSDISSFKYAVGVCCRLGTGLEILYIPDKADMTIMRFEAELKQQNIRYNLIKSGGRLTDDIQSRTETGRNILFAVISAPGNEKNTDPGFSILARKLKCPLVTVSGAEQK